MKGLLLAGVPVLLIALLAAQAVPPGGQGPALTYTISLQVDGSATWNMEYRTPLLTAADTASFRNYSDQVQQVYLPGYIELMRQSAAQAATATGRPVEVSGFSADSAIQSGPTGSYGVVHYRCQWSGFAKSGESLTVGDVFVGGLYLGKDHALVIHPPPGFAVAEATPQPDGTQDGLVWYGMRSFGAGEPRIVLRNEPVPFLAVAVVLLLAVVIGAGVFIARRKFRKPSPVPPAPPAPVGETPAGPAWAGAGPEPGEKILAMLTERGGSAYQSEIVSALGLPKSTVSEAINRLHEEGRVEKVRKGRENLIRTRKEGQGPGSPGSPPPGVR